jgi:hypothetical protein
MLFRIFPFVSILLVGYSTSVNASQVHETELNQIENIQKSLNTQRDWVNYRYQKALADCYNRLDAGGVLIKLELFFKRVKSYT